MLLAFGMFVECATSGVCFCGKCFPKAIQDETYIQINTVFHESDLRGICRNCRLKNGNSAKAINFFKQALNTKVFNAFPGCALKISHSSGMPSRPAPFKTTGGFQNHPVYLLDLSFRC